MGGRGDRECVVRIDQNARCSDGCADQSFSRVHAGTVSQGGLGPAPSRADDGAGVPTDEAARPVCL